MLYALISVAFVCLLSAVACVAAAVRFLNHSDSLKQAQSALAAQVHLSNDAVNSLRGQVTALNTEHWENASSRISGVTGRVADMEAQVSSLKESQRNFEAKINARVSRAKKEADEGAPPELEPEDSVLSQLRAAGIAVPLNGSQQEPPTRRADFGRKAGGA